MKISNKFVLSGLFMMDEYAVNYFKDRRKTFNPKKPVKAMVEISDIFMTGKYDVSIHLAQKGKAYIDKVNPCFFEARFKRKS